MALPNVYPVGALITLEDSLTDPLSDPPNQPIDDPTEHVTIWREDGSLFTPTPPCLPVLSGSVVVAYRASFSPDVPGEWRYQFAGSRGAGPVVAIEVYGNPSTV